MGWLSVVLHILGLLAIIATLLPLWRTTRWWVRILDFPRFQVALVCLTILIAWMLVPSPVGVD